MFWLSASLVLSFAVVILAQETLYGLPPIPGVERLRAVYGKPVDGIPFNSAAKMKLVDRQVKVQCHNKITTIANTASTSAPPPSSTHRIFRFGPFIPFIPLHQLPAQQNPFLHPTLPPQLAHPFDPYNNINPVPELPPQPESKYNGYYDLDGNFVSYGSEGALGLNGRRPKRATRVDNEDDTLKLKLLEEEYAYDEEMDQQAKSTVNSKLTTTKRPNVQPSLPSKPQFVSGNARPQSVVQPSIIDRPPVNLRPRNDANVSNKLPLRPNPNAKHVSTAAFTSTVRPMHSNRVTTKKQKKTDLFDISALSRALFGGTKSGQKPSNSNYKPKQQFPNRQQPQPLPTNNKLPNQQPRPRPLQVAQQQPVFQSQPRFIQQVPQTRAWAAPVVVDTRDPTVIAYLKDLEDYDWQYAGERPDLDLPARLLKQQQVVVTTPETLVPLSNGNGRGALVGTTLAPFVPARVTGSFTAPAPAVTPARLPAYTPAPGADILGLFGGTPHPLFDFNRLFGGFGGRR
ncbi:hypothetical protein M3Y98_00863100 [Aphelenchoides besseyi]|nr:hypothetical protein M3Y98_00863100 [Aphelenchoides besseyi]KAI6211198.1 hypothetical protein M3Y96_00408400 [Aphelenchoides besseyi]